MKYYKILNEEEKHYGLQYRTGLNVDRVLFNDDPTASCVKGGIYFTDAEHIFAFADYGPWIREVTIPEGARMLKDPGFGPTKYRADRVILGERRKWKDVEVLKEFVAVGADIHINMDCALRQAACAGYLKTVQYLVEQGADIHVCDEYALRMAAQNGYLEVVRYLVEQGADIHVHDDCVLCGAVTNRRLEIVQYLVEQGANIHAKANWVLRWAASNNHLKVAQYIESKYRIKNAGHLIKFS